VFNFTIKVTVKTFEEYIINAFNYMLRYTTSDWCHNYMLEFPDCIFSELTRHFANVIGGFRMTTKYALN
jgi:hypothetical protein